MSLNQDLFKEKRKNVEKKWSKSKALKYFNTYLKNQWINGKFSWWQIYHTEAGLALCQYLNYMTNVLYICVC